MLMQPISRRLILFNFRVFKLQIGSTASVFSCALLRISSVECDILIFIWEGCRESKTGQPVRVPLMALMKLFAMTEVPL